MTKPGPQCITVHTRSPDETERLGALIASLLPRGAVVALRGELASGKTCFVRGMAAAVSESGGPGRVHSPTFTLVNEYGQSPRLYHMDLYRLGGADELADLGYEELFDSDGICAVEWAERAEPLLPAARLDILLEHEPPTDADSVQSRRVTLCDNGLLPNGWRGRVADLTDAAPAP
ncbi:MAG: tRNA (adenosine(37)-N6)-threonylcarbamoyltransferase complex ATPase subunit type 1 TsaE [Candidatus Hydrogenedentes bacterium]|nr:tRNA (adenosine(37)-N6)-threonylcarbamoyltransferase complex ATPase subunit type 1 TsaE [Candidatus Hydrogenedentota bacterium]